MDEQWIDQHDPDPFAAGGLREKFASRYKSGAMFQHADPTQVTTFENNIFSYHTVAPNVTTAQPAGTPGNFDIPILIADDINSPTGNRADPSTSLGFLNHSFGKRWTAGGPASTQQEPYLGVPDGDKFPWVVWHDRPFASPYEVMLVPFTSAARLNLECSTPSMLSGLYNATPPPAANVYFGDDNTSYRSDYQHCLNFFASNDDFTKSGNFHRLLEWLETPDPYDDSVSMPNADRFYSFLGQFADSSWPPTNATTWNMIMPMESFRVPFNQFGDRIRRGAVNLNTINGNRVYRELMHGISLDTEVKDAPNTAFDAKGALYDAFVISRRGYNGSGGSVSTNIPIRLDPRFDPDFPTEQAGVFVPGAVADLAPKVRGTPVSGRGWPNSYDADQLRRTPVESGLLRPAPSGTATNTRGPFATVTSDTDPNKPLPLFMREDTSSPHQDRDRSAFHRYQGITRLANMTTDQSNVFAVWTTIGFFEVDMSIDTTTNSPKMSVGQEYGFDEGTNSRNRSFMIIDRSIPVEYAPGVDSNTRDVILLHRVLN